MGAYSFTTKGVCARKINFVVENGVIGDVEFVGGCNGNLKAIGKLVKGKKAEEVAEILKGNTCGMRSTSCADQFSIALKQALEREAQ